MIWISWVCVMMYFYQSNPYMIVVLWITVSAALMRWGLFMRVYLSHRKAKRLLQTGSLPRKRFLNLLNLEMIAIEP